MGGEDINVSGHIQSPQQLITDWLESLYGHGLECEFYPEENILHHMGGVWIAKTKVIPDRFPRAEKYPQYSCFVDFKEFAINYNPNRTDKIPGGWNCAPDYLKDKLQRSNLYAWFNSKHQGLIQLRFFYFAGATLALVTDGIFSIWDGEQHKELYLTGPEAIEFAKQRMEYYETLPGDVEPWKWKGTPFTSWDDEEFFPKFSEEEEKLLHDVTDDQD